MPFSIEYNEEQDFILSTFTGKISMKVVNDYIADLLPVLEKTGCKRVLNDSTEGQIHFSALDIMQFPRLAEHSLLTKELRRAVLTTGSTSGYELYETLSKLKGQQLKVFTDRDQAIDWLLEGTKV